MKYEEAMNNCIKQLKADWEQANKLDKDNYNMDVCVNVEERYGDGIATIKDMQSALQEYSKSTTFNEGFIKVTNKLIYDVDAWADNGEVEIEGVYTELQVYGYKPMTESEFNKLLSNEFLMNNLFKSYLAPVLLENAKKLELDNSYRMYTAPCNVLNLYKQGILDFDGLTKAVYSNC